MTGRKDPKRENSERIEETRYVGAIPEEILEELTPEMIRQYFDFCLCGYCNPDREKRYLSFGMPDEYGKRNGTAHVGV